MNLWREKFRYGRRRRRRRRRKISKFYGYIHDGSVYTSHELENNNYIDDETFDMMMLIKKQEEYNLYKKNL